MVCSWSGGITIHLRSNGNIGDADTFQLANGITSGYCGSAQMHELIRTTSRPCVAVTAVNARGDPPLRLSSLHRVHDTRENGPQTMFAIRTSSHSGQEIHPGGSANFLSLRLPWVVSISKRPFASIIGCLPSGESVDPAVAHARLGRPRSPATLVQRVRGLRRSR